MARKHTIVLETRLSIETIAGLARAYTSVFKIPIRTKSELIRTALEDHLDHLNKAAKLSPIVSPSEALATLHNCGLSATSKGGQNRKALLAALSEESVLDSGSALDRDIQRAKEELDRG